MGFIKKNASFFSRHAQGKITKINRGESMLFVVKVLLTRKSTFRYFTSMSEITSNPAVSPESHDATLRVLLVDDQEDILHVMHLILERRGNFQVETASSGMQALEKAESFAPHVVISDLSMPEMDGCELMSQLRCKPCLTPFKSIALSGYGSTYQEAAKDAGFDTHLVKPVDFDQLFEVIDQLSPL